MNAAHERFEAMQRAVKVILTFERDTLTRFARFGQGRTPSLAELITEALLETAAEERARIRERVEQFSGSDLRSYILTELRAGGEGREEGSSST